MSKGKKQPQKEEPVKLDKSFEDAIRLAVNASPAMQVKLVPDIKTEIKGVKGRVLEFIRIAVVNKLPDDNSIVANAGHFYVEAETKNGEKIDTLRLHIMPVGPNQVHSHTCEFLKINDRYPEVRVLETLYLTVKPMFDLKHHVHYGMVYYVKHLKAKSI